jgi:hypothetical protein
MTDDLDERLDLSALDAGDDPVRTSALIARIGARARAVPQMDGDVAALRRAQRTLAATAAILVAMAATVVFITRREAVATLTGDPIASWAESRHVPTNGELLAVFQGYQP